ncbi:MAG: DUF3575 domain-containing protein [Crocinitomicaceae bacterium]|nr:DUF3575 domain-containing protein [Crocinitomicaceae bacterium]
MRNILLGILILFSFNAKSQSDLIFSNKLSVRLAPLSLIDFYNGSCYKIGLEVSLFKSTSITADYGGYFKNFNVWKNYTGYNIDVGLKYYLKHQLHQGFYISLNYFYKNQGFDYKDSIKEASSAYYTEYRTQKYVTCVNINIGMLNLYNKRFILDFFGGIGIRYKNVSSSISIDDLKNGIEYNDSQSLYFIVTPGEFIYPNINLGLRIGVKII